MSCDLCSAKSGSGHRPAVEAAYTVDLELAIDWDMSEETQLDLCEMHYALHVQTRLAACSLAQSSKSDDDFLNGELKLSVFRYEPDEGVGDEVGEWKLCPEHAKELWNLNDAGGAT